MRRICSVEGCERKTKARGWCDMHWKRWWRHGTLENPRPFRGFEGCLVQECRHDHYSNGYCQLHYNRTWRLGVPSITHYQETHGLSKTLEYNTWQGMMQRCYNKHSPKYKNYGGRGIKICTEWLHSFSLFYKDMGKKPFPLAQIDRIDNNGDYTKDNCHWVANVINARNKRSTKLSMPIAREIRMMFKTGVDTQVAYAEKYGVSQATIWDVLRCNIWREQ